jgi:ribosomal protein S1
MTKTTKSKKEKVQKPAKKTVKKAVKETAKKEKVKTLPKISTEKLNPPTTMEELLAQTGYKLKGLKRGETVEGIISEIGKKKMLIDIGAKTEGVVLEKEFELSRDFISTMKVGDKIRVIVGMPENERGQILLSLRRAAEDYKWSALEELIKSGDAVEVRGLDVNKGGMIARCMDVYGFIPVSQFGRTWLGNLDKLYNKVFKVKVIEVDRTKNRLIFSEKAVSEAQALASQGEALKKVSVGDSLEGIVSGIMPFGIFVRVDIKSEKEAENLFLEGLVHISEVSWEKVENLNKLFKVGDKIKVKVLGIDKISNRLNLSIKQLQLDPWTKMIEQYPLEKKVEGTVTKLAAFGAFISLKPGVEGLVHISKIPADFSIKVGDTIDVYIENVDTVHHRIALGLVLAKKPVGYK